MSWIVQSLLNKRGELKEKADINNDDFNDLLVVERAIENLKSDGKLTEAEIDILNFPYMNGGRNEKYSFSKRYYAICQKIAEHLGGYFTDDGYLNYMKYKYKLSEAQIDTLKQYIKSKYKNKIMRKPLNE